MAYAITTSKGSRRGARRTQLFALIGVASVLVLACANSVAPAPNSEPNSDITLAARPGASATPSVGTPNPTAPPAAAPTATGSAGAPLTTAPIVAPSMAPAPKALSAPAEQALLARVKKVITRRKLTTLPLDQLSFEIEPGADGITFVNVREKHTAAGGGDPQTAPRLFSFRTDATQALATDALSDTGEF
jgi:hypothetical protein